MTPLSWALVVVGAAVVSAVVVRLVLPVLTRRGIVDVPAHRSLHATPTPRGGGIGVLAAVLAVGALVAVVGLPAGASGTDTVWPLLLVPVLALGLVGLVDDVRSTPVGPRFLAQAGAGLLLGLVLCRLTGHSLTWVVPVVLATLVLVNATNFMDGANGLVAMHGVVTGGWYLVVALVVDVPAAAALAAAALGAAAGFLPFNLPAARVFLGDVGSYTLGALWAVLGTWLLMLGAAPEVVVAPILVLLADTGATMVRRLLEGDVITTPHRLHVYQRLVGAGWSHSRVTVVVAATTATLGVLALPALLGASGLMRTLALALSLLVCLGYLSLTVPAGEHARWRTARESMPR